MPCTPVLRRSMGVAPSRELIAPLTAARAAAACTEFLARSSHGPADQMQHNRATLFPPWALKGGLGQRSALSKDYSVNMSAT